MRVAPVVEGLLAYHEARWATMHPFHIPRLKDHYAKQTRKMNLPRKIESDPISKMLEGLEETKQIPREEAVASRERNFAPEQRAMSGLPGAYPVVNQMEREREP